MPLLTVTEKEHWKKRVAAKIDKHLEATAASDPGQVKFALQKSAAVSPASWSTLFTSYGGTTTFTDNNNPTSFYRTQSSAGGQTSPFSAVFSVP